MSKKSPTNRLVRKTARNISAATSADVDRLRSAMHGRVDTSDIPERRKFQRVRRDANGRLPPRNSMIRDAVTKEMQRQHLSVYRLWRMAKEHYPPMSQAAVHEFLKGKRKLELPSVEALLAAVELRVVR